MPTRRPSRPAFSIAAMAAAVFCVAIGCVPPVRDDTVDGPEPPNDLQVVGVSNPANVFTGATVQLSATASGGTPPYIFRWDQNGGPISVTLAAPTTDRTATTALTEPGQYAFRVTVADAGGFHEVDYLPVVVLDPFDADVPELAVVGQAAPLTADISQAPAGTTILWEVAAGPAEIANPTSENATLNATAAGTIDLALTVEVPSAGQPQVITRDFEVAATASLRPRVRLETSAGDFSIELDGVLAPLHTANFLLYVDDGFYDGLLIHRVVCDENPLGGDCNPFVVQGGGYRREGDELVEVEATRDPVMSEADNGLSNGELYSVSLALLGGNVDSGETQFFINLDVTNDFLDNQGFTVFGRVVVGTDVVDEIVRVDTMASPVIPGEQSLPEVDIVIERVSRLAN